jgi:transposase
LSRSASCAWPADRGQGPQRRHGAATGPGRHGSPAAARAALRAQDDPRQGESLPPAAARHGEARAPVGSARLALRSLARRIQTLDEEIAALDKQLERLVRNAAPRTTALLGISTGHAGQLLVSAGQNIERLRGESSFAALCGAGPIPASSGKTSRHRLNYGGDRDANRALHLIAVCRLRYCPRTRAYAKRRSAQGKSKPEIIRCLKRYIARQTYRTLTADLTSVRPQQRPSRVTTI